MTSSNETRGGLQPAVVAVAGAAGGGATATTKAATNWHPFRPAKAEYPVAIRAGSSERCAVVVVVVVLV